MKKYTSTIALVVSIAVIGMAAVGCSLASFIEVDVPKDIAAAVGTEPVVSLNEAGKVLEDYTVIVAKNLSDFNTSIEDKTELHNTLAHYLNLGLGVLGTLVTGPMGVGVVGLLGIAGTMLAPRLGEGKRKKNAVTDAVDLAIKEYIKEPSEIEPPVESSPLTE